MDGRRRWIFLYFLLLAVYICGLGLLLCCADSLLSCTWDSPWIFPTFPLAYEAGNPHVACNLYFYESVWYLSFLFFFVLYLGGNCGYIWVACVALSSARWYQLIALFFLAFLAFLWLCLTS